MGLRINTNVSSLAAQRSLRNTSEALNGNLRKLSSGSRITRAGDDAAGLAISENLRAQIRGFRQAKRNAGDAISLIQTAEGALGEISNIVIRLRELAIQSSSDTVGDQERGFSDIEFQTLKEEIDRISQSSEFSGIKLLNGTAGKLEFQIGVNNDPLQDRISYDATAADTTLAALGISVDNVGSKLGAQASLKKLDNSLVHINGVRARLGATQSASDENLSAANSRIRDVDIAAETAKLTKNNILIQAGSSVLSQANQFHEVALKLLG